jgi:hypothetical protein
MSTEKLYIDGTIFQILGKYQTLDGDVINISSTKDGVTTNFDVYSSKSQGGFWRLYLPYSDTRIFYKGLDYAQQTFIHLELQEFIEKNIDKIKDRGYKSIRGYTSEEIKELEKEVEGISYEKRKIDACIFDVYNKNKKMLCGKKINKLDINILSNKLKEKYNYNTSVLESKYFEERKRIVKLDNDHICEIIFTIYNTTLTLKDTINENDAIESCNKQSEDIILIYMTYTVIITYNGEQSLNKQGYIPLYLTTNKEITAYGLYKNFVPAGNFICKIFDYTFQCDVEKKYSCSHTYSYLGDKYMDVWPLNEILPNQYNREEKPKYQGMSTDTVMFRRMGEQYNIQKEADERADVEIKDDEIQEEYDNRKALYEERGWNWFLTETYLVKLKSQLKKEKWIEKHKKMDELDSYQKYIKYKYKYMKLKSLISS